MSKQASRVRRTFSHSLTRETTALRYNPATGVVSRPERAGSDVGPFVYVKSDDVEACRMAWRRGQAALLLEGFEITGTENY